MITLTLAELAAAVDGRLVGADPTATVTGAVEFDSRKVRPGGLFVAFDGEKVDGHDYAARAVADGAVAVLGTREVPGVPMVLVADALAALGRLARAVVDRLPELTVIGITGSSGKTTTKDLIAQLTARLGPTVAPPGSFNNELGHPYTALQAGPDTRFLVLEKGARGVGHVRYLCDVVPPRISVVLNVGVAHIGEFGSRETIAMAKGELVEALPVDGLAVLNADDPLVAAMATRTRGRVVRYGEAVDADVRATDVTLDDRGRPSYTLVTPEGAVPVRLGLTGHHQVSNSLAAAAVARELGMPLADLAEALGGLGLVSTRRMDVFDRPDGVTVIDDSYNANPASMAVALRALAGMRRNGRTIAVLGYMAELGPFEVDGHREVGRLAAELGVDRLLVVDAAAAPIQAGATAVGNWGGESVLLTDQAAAVEVLRSELRPGDVVLVKGSRYRTWEVADALRVGTGGEDAQ
ncbi:UDP-N-acetylmuramoyl-tripeptide--D-alanyl-D-alanine ligase [Micromonospora sagamiensis]|uniref:UDP-N-acetylmuramoyl-tripeptide--D-alanyl-D-alanine ligase n=1 Tax=Micromonospora sagamiensis TaxID=47875 RepID=A0A562WDQ2_9ACTN|nr:UDP-N-acetylmuramoyl-tripeptide--D-alanyl-D-alanine ligase [Micromonospora sagamiensis]TWJ28151.1 UDP-N-acetylmuramoyl-tripeptide--D-alanyl-D-alanine ligase [Micromonospora sagamiensis]BCL12960.1 UDP-N-acetylmuramoyl-tripeptide--D-alanyl-D-alanine ligase [Micromonospora sagamiensis]